MNDHKHTQQCRLKWWNTSIYPEGLKLKRWVMTSVGEDMKLRERSCIAGAKAKWYNLSGSQFGSLFVINIELTCDPVIPLLGMYPREVETHVHGKICHQTFLAVLFVTAPNWKEPKYLSAVNGIMLSLICPVEHYSIVTRSKLQMYTAM